MKTRMIEMYIGEGGDSGTWGTEFVDIPRDTQEDKIEAVAIEVAENEFNGIGVDFAFVGVYSIMDLDESDEMNDYED